jgi:pimeloyl-ACP methyl ester carboxylesterase
MTDRHTLLLIHGFPQDRSLWTNTAHALSDKAAVLAPDLRGFGEDRRPLPEAMTMEAYAADLKELLDEQHIARVVLCGLSMGGYIALAFLERWPERVQGLILCNTKATADTEEGKAARAETAWNAFDKGVSVIARGMVPKVLSERTRREKPELAIAVEAMMARQRPEAVAAAALGMALRPDRSPLLPSITVPTLIITGSDDSLMPLPTSEAMHAAIAGSELVVLPDAAHLSNLEDPVRFNATVERFLASLPHA